MKKFLSVLLAVCMIFGMISIMPLAAGAAETTGTRTISVGVINYLTDELGTDGYNVHYWGGADGANDALLTRDGTKVEYKILSDEFVGWKGQQQTFYMFTATIPADATGFKVHNGDRWFGEDGADQDKVYIFNYSGDKALYEKTEVTPEPETTAPTTAPATTAPTEVATDAPIVGGITYYLVGDMTGWEIDPDYALTKNAAAEADEYMISGVAFTAEQGFKVVGYNSSIQDFEAVWYPDGTDNDCVIHDAGTYDIYFRPNYDGGEDWYYGCIYVVAPEAPTEAPSTAPTEAPSTAPTEAATDAPIVGGITYYLVGDMTDWEIDPDYALTKNAAAEADEYMISGVTFTAEQGFKVVGYNSSIQDFEAVWYPDGMDNDCVIHDAGTYDIYFRPNYDGGEDWYYGCIYVVAPEVPTEASSEAASETPTQPATDAPIVGGITYYLVGDMTGWEIDPDYALTKNAAAEADEYMISGVTFTAEQGFKVVGYNSSIQDFEAVWYPDGMDNDCVIHDAGTYDIYFRPNYDGGEDWYYGCIYVTASTEPSTEPATEPATEPVEHTTAIVDGKFYIDGKLAKGYGLVQFEDEIYFVQRDGSVFTSGKVTVSEDKTNDILPAGTYVFDDEGKLVNSGSIVDGKYYEKGKIVRAAGVVQVKSGFYFVKRDGSVLTGEKITVSETASNGLIPAGTYRAAENGKLDISGIINGYYYKDGKIILGAGVVQFKSGLYFIKRNGTVMTSGKITISETASNGLISPGTYRIDETGKLPTSGVINGYYYKNGTIAKGAGVVEFNGDFYFVKRDGSVFTSGKVTVSEDKTNGLVDAGTYSFDADGKLIAE